MNIKHVLDNCHTGVRISLFATIALLYLQAFSVYIFRRNDVLFFRDGIIQSEQPALLFIMLALSFFAVLLYGALYYFLRKQIGDSIDLRLFIAIASSGIASIVMISTVQLFYFGGISWGDFLPDHSRALTPDGLKMAALIFSSIAVMIIHATLFAVGFWRLVGAYKRAILLLSVLMGLLCVISFVVILDHFVYWVLIDSFSIDTYPLVFALNFGHLWLNILLWVSAFVFTLALISALWNLPHRESSIVENQHKKACLRKVNWVTATMYLGAILVGITIALWVPLLLLIGWI